MTKQIKTLMGVALLTAAVSASAQIKHAVQIKVPFPFVTADKSWPAAVYQVEISPDNGILALRSDDATPAVMLTTPAERLADSKATMRFQCSGNRWVLQEVVLDGTARILPVSQLQKEQAELPPTCQETAAASVRSIP